MRRIAPVYSSQPKANIAGIVIAIVSSGSSPVAVQIEYVRNAPTMRNAPCATLMTPITPKISVSPDAISAYTPPIRSPRMIAWTNSVMVASPGCRPSGTPPGAARPAAPYPSRARGLLDDGLGRRRRLRQHDLRLAVLPLADQELALRGARLVPLERPEDRVHGVRADPVGQLRLVADAADGLDRGLHDLRRGERVRRVLGRLAAAEHRVERLDELGVARRRGLRVPADGVERALGVLDADALGVLVGERRRARLEEVLRREADLVERAHEVHAVGERRAVHEDVRVGRLDRVGDRVEVRVLVGVLRAVDGLDAGRLELLADAVEDGQRERVVERRVRRRLRPLARRQLEDVVGEDVALVVGRGLLREEDVLVAAVEDVGRAAGRLDVELAVALGDRGRRQVQQRGEGAEQHVDLLAADQRVVVGDDGVLVARVVADDDLDLAPEQAALAVDHLLPDLVALAGCLAGLGEVTGERQRSADADRL